MSFHFFHRAELMLFARVRVAHDHLNSAMAQQSGQRTQEIANLFDAQIKEGQEFAYGLAGEIRDQLLAAETEDRKAKHDESHSPTLLLENGFARDDRELDLP